MVIPALNNLIKPRKIFYEAQAGFVQVPNTVVAMYRTRKSTTLIYL